MKNVTFRRVIAYLLDLFLVGVISSFIAFIPFLNPNKEQYNEKYDQVLELFSKYQREEITYEEYETQFKYASYDLNKLNINYVVIDFVVLIAYFGIFQWQRKGQTLGKQLMKLKVVANKEEKDLNFLSYFIRTIILNNLIISFLQIGTLYLFDVEHFYPYYSNLNIVGYILLYITIFLIFIRLDHRGLHDFVANTKVISIMEENKEEKKSKEKDDVEEAKYEEKKKEIKQKSTKTKN